jgi:hypothetical protein
MHILGDDITSLLWLLRGNYCADSLEWLIHDIIVKLYDVKVN